MNHNFILKTMGIVYMFFGSTKDTDEGRMFAVYGFCLFIRGSADKAIEENSVKQTILEVD